LLGSCLGKGKVTFTCLWQLPGEEKKKLNSSQQNGDRVCTGQSKRKRGKKNHKVQWRPKEITPGNQVKRDARWTLFRGDIQNVRWQISWRHGQKKP